MNILPLEDVPFTPTILPSIYVKELLVHKIISEEEYKALEDGKAVFIKKLAWCVMSQLVAVSSVTHKP